MRDRVEAQAVSVLAARWRGKVARARCAKLAAARRLRTDMVGMRAVVRLQAVGRGRLARGKARAETSGR